MDNPESQSTMGPQDIGQKRKQTKNYTTQKTKKINVPLHFAFFHMCFNDNIFIMGLLFIKSVLPVDIMLMATTKAHVYLI
jgi:hypothetical protein